MEKQMMDTKEAAEYLGVSFKTLQNKRSSIAGGPPFVRIGGRVLYRITDLEKYIEENTFTSNYPRPVNS